MKRIINGVTYNTETATLVAEVTYTDEGSGTVTEAELFQNRAGVYFDVDTVTTKYRDRHGEMQERVAYEWFDVGDAAAARAWTEKYEMTIVRDIEDMPPEAEPGEKLATLYVRLPPSLKTAVEEKAKAVGVSANVFVLRCLEGCVLPKRAYEQNGLSQMLNYMLLSVHDGAVMALGGVMAKDDAEAKQKAAEEIKDKLDRMVIEWNATISITRPDGSALPGISATDLAKLV